MSAEAELGILARRRIEAEVIKPIYETLCERLGQEQARALIGEAIAKTAVAVGRDFAAREPGGADLHTFADLQRLWTQDDALEVTVLQADKDAFSYDVHRCRYAEMYRDMGLGEIGHLLSCNRDHAFIEGYDPDVELTRTTTIMSGGTCCDFRYRAKKPEGGS
ncbi:L-2-amino-thiazoline-4-carboxylic acid hydrolase [Enterovirga rhinocerotis]|uniref:L-2-amino-thiazoline-4-carboxylic acid hydrolase-like protein n=1 Tax=Enterovirga rhinocerotis TaxID=1339210 RepID=A0A4R7BV07_9HYPH|nr:L-2-amino-thiazoline-4-carboxylic acid hydrolase [Enterovirga rhinocerotis]TDR88882.1 L-2-amino-thiazoline-4-carboxylic acid hydrolase-like protein [Enterovirga rhinocerotis]